MFWSDICIMLLLLYFLLLLRCSSCLWYIVEGTFWLGCIPYSFLAHKKVELVARGGSVRTLDTYACTHVATFPQRSGQNQRQQRQRFSLLSPPEGARAPKLGSVLVLWHEDSREAQTDQNKGSDFSIFLKSKTKPAGGSKVLPGRVLFKTLAFTRYTRHR